MKCFQILGAALVASSASAIYQHDAHHTISAAPAISYSRSAVVAAPAISYGAAAAPISYAAPAFSVAAPAISTIAAAPAYSVAAPAISTQAVVRAAPAALQSHEIHTGGAANSIRVEEYRAANQLIRVHDSAQRAPSVINVQGPAAAGNHIRLISRNGPTQVQRAVIQDPNVQAFDVVNPPQPGDRIINIRGAPAPPARVELVAEQHHAAPEIHVGSNEAHTQVVRAGTIAAPAYAASYAAPAISTGFAAAPAYATSYAAPTISTGYAAPAISYAAAPAYASGYSSYAAPVSSYGYGASTYGYNYGSNHGSSVVLHKA